MILHTLMCRLHVRKVNWRESQIAFPNFQMEFGRGGGPHRRGRVLGVEAQSLTVVRSGLRDQGRPRSSACTSLILASRSSSRLSSVGQDGPDAPSPHLLDVCLVCVSSAVTPFRWEPLSLPLHLRNANSAGYNMLHRGHLSSVVTDHELSAAFARNMPTSLVQGGDGL